MLARKSFVEQKLEGAKAQVPVTEKDNQIKIWTSFIRRKITGEANEILLQSNWM